MPSPSLKDHQKQKTTTKNKKNLSVQFKAKVRVRKITMLKEMPMELINDLYFSQDELAMLRLQLRNDLKSYIKDQRRRMKQQQQQKNNDNVDGDDDNEFQMRGLEGELDSERKLTKLLAKKEVMKLQYLQHKVGQYDLEMIAEAYNQKALPAIKVALELAAQDADEVL
jgi:hypothetical protein